MAVTFLRKGDGAKYTVSDPIHIDSFRNNPDWEEVVEEVKEQTVEPQPPVKGKGRPAKR